MAANPIFVEAEEEVPEVVERLRRYRGDDTTIVLPMRSRIGQSRFNFQLLRNYSARMGKRVTVVCDDPAVQKMASESGFPVFGALGPKGEGIPSEPEPVPVPRKWWQRSRKAPTTHVLVAAPRKLATKRATELKPGRFILFVTAGLLLIAGLFAAFVYVPSASVTLVAQASPFTTKDVVLPAQPGKGTIRVRVVSVSRSNSQGFKTTGTIDVPLAPATGLVVYTNPNPTPSCVPPTRPLCKSPGVIIPYGQRLMNTNGLEFAQTSATYQGQGVLVPWNNGTVQANVIAVLPGTTGNVGNDTITTLKGSNPWSIGVTNPQATGGGTDPSTTPVMTEADFDAGRAQLEAGIHQAIAQQLVASVQTGEKLSETIIYGPPQYTTDHQPNDHVPSFSGTMTVAGEGDFYFDSDVQKSFQTYLSQRVPTNLQMLTESPIQVQYRILAATAGGLLTFVGTSSAYVAPRLDTNTILSQIRGKPVAQAKFYLDRLPVRSATIKEEPLTLPLMPLLLSRISLHYVVQQGTPNASQAAPSPSPAASPSASP
ncbi:MAG: baseplate J/gp47 family protein [Candidatus Dormibacterales bacterium]